MGDTKVELGDDVAASYGSELVVKQEDLEGAMNSMKQHAPIWNGVKADYPAWLWEAVPFLDSMGLKKYRPPVLNEEQHTNMLKHGTRLASNGDTHTCIDRVPMQCFGRGSQKPSSGAFPRAAKNMVKLSSVPCIG